MRQLEPWYFAYGLLGLVAAGLLPLVLPLWVAKQSGVAQVGVVMAALSLGQLCAPWWGNQADHKRQHRLLFVSGWSILGVALLLVVVLPPALYSVSSLLMGVGIAAISTLANLFIVERFPKRDWPGRVSALQTVYGAGRVVGLVLAGFFSGHLHTTLLFTALVPLLALLFTFSLPHLPNTPLLTRPAVPVHKLEHNSLFNHYHLRLALPKTLPKPWLCFLSLWFLASFGAALVFAFYPLLMKAYGVSTDVAAWSFAAAVALSLALYAPVGRFVTKLGGRHVLFLGCSLRALSLAGLFSVSLLPVPFHIPVALTSFALLVLTWSLLSIAGTTLAADSSLPEGEAMGIFSAVSALAGVLGSLIGGLLAHEFGCSSLPLAACLVLTLCAALVPFLKRAGSETVLK